MKASETCSNLDVHDQPCNCRQRLNAVRQQSGTPKTPSESSKTPTGMSARDARFYAILAQCQEGDPRIWQALADSDPDS